MICVRKALYAILILLLPSLVSAGAALASALLADCPRASQFCADALSFAGKVQLKVKHATAYLTSSTETVTQTQFTITKVLTSTGTTITLSSPVTKTVAHTTTTVQECRPINSCGPVTVTGHQDVLRAACTSVLRHFSGKSTFTVTYGQPATYIYGSTRTSTKSVDATTTTFPVVTATVPTKTVYDCVTAPPPAASCKNGGIQNAIWDLTKKDAKTPPLQWNITYYKTVRPIRTTDYDLVGGYLVNESSKRKRSKKRSTQSINGCGAPFYNNARGYIYAPQTGNYHFYIPAYDQAAFVWVGEVAYSGYNISNALVKAFKPGHATEGGPYANFHMEAGKYYAFRSAFRCISLEDYSYWFNIRRPDGFVMFGEYQHHGEFPSVLGSSSYSRYHTGVHYVESDYVVQFGCGADAEKAPKYPKFGHET